MTEHQTVSILVNLLSFSSPTTEKQQQKQANRLGLRLKNKIFFSA